MFVDASAIVAVLTGEPDADALANALDAARAPITSAVAAFEATLGLCRKRHASVAEAQGDVSEFLAMAGVRTVSIAAREAEAALDAFALRQGARPPRPAQHGGLLRLRGGQDLPDSPPVQGRRLQQNRCPVGTSGRVGPDRVAT